MSKKPLDSDVMHHWICDGRIIVFTMHDVSREAVDRWITTVVRHLQAWPRDRVQLVLYDVASPGYAPTPYITAQIPAISEASQGLRGRYAILMPPEERSVQMIRFRHRQFSPMGTPIEGRLFTDRDEAISWLREALNSDDI